MTVLTTHPWLVLFWLLAAGLHLAAVHFPGAKWLGWILSLTHAAAVPAYFLADGELEDVLVFLLFSLTLYLALAYFLPDKRLPGSGAPEDGKEDKA